MNSSPHTGLIAAQHQKYGDDVEEAVWYWPSLTTCPYPTVTVDDSWIEWEGDADSGWTPFFYISNPVYGGQDSDNIFWHLSVWTKDSSLYDNAKYVTVEELEAGIDLSDFDSNLADTDNCFTNTYPAVWGWAVIAKLQVIYSCEDPPEPYYGTEHTLGPAGANFNGPQRIGQEASGRPRVFHFAVAPCESDPVYEVEDCADNSTWYIHDGMYLIDTSGNSGEFVAWYDSNNDAHCGVIIATSSETSQSPIYNAVWFDCDDCESSMGI